MYKSSKREHVTNILTLASSRRYLEVDARDADGNTSLHTAVTLRDEAAVRALLEAGADPSIANRYIPSLRLFM